MTEYGKKTATTDDTMAKQLIAARYTYHRQMITKYASHPDGDALYRRSMQNYDDIIARAGEGGSQEANIGDMEKGFYL